jgi:deoxycytidylate deaminase
MYRLSKITDISKLSKKELVNLNLAIDEAEKSSFKQPKKIGAVIDSGCSKIAGENQHREQYGRIHYKSLHAEMNALFKTVKRERKNRLSLGKGRLIRTSVTIYIVRICKPTGISPSDSRGYVYGCSKPCLNCEKHLYYYNVTRIKYTDIIDGKSVLCEMKMN